MRRLVFRTVFVLIVGLAVAVYSVSANAQNLQRTTLLVERLVCTSCLGLIEENLQKIPGVLGMSADLRSGTVTADHTLRISGPQIAEAVSRLGYPASLVKQEEVASNKVNKFSNSFAKCGVGGCSTGGCNATASAWKELYRKYIKK